MRRGDARLLLLWIVLASMLSACSSGDPSPGGHKERSEEASLSVDLDPSLIVDEEVKILINSRVESGDKALVSGLVGPPAEVEFTVVGLDSVYRIRLTQVGEDALESRLEFHNATLERIRELTGEEVDWALAGKVVVSSLDWSVGAEVHCKFDLVDEDGERFQGSGRCRFGPE